MQFYGYQPDVNGREPLGTDCRVLFTLKTVKGAVARMQRISSNWPRGFRLYSYSNFYDEKTFVFRASNVRNLNV